MGRRRREGGEVQLEQSQAGKLGRKTTGARSGRADGGGKGQDGWTRLVREVMSLE